MVINNADYFHLTDYANEEYLLGVKGSELERILTALNHYAANVAGIGEAQEYGYIIQDITRFMEDKNEDSI